MRNALRWLLAIAALGVVIAQFLLFGAIIALANRLGFWAYPVHFALSMVFAASVLGLFLPPEHKRLVAIPWVQRFLTIDEKRFAGKHWSWIRRRGPFVLVLAVALAFGAFVAAVVIRYLGLDERRAWVYSLLSTLVTTIVTVSIYLGALSVIRNMLMSIFGE